MNRQEDLISKLFSIRNRYGPGFSFQKQELLRKISREPLTGKWAIKTFYDTTLFLMAYPDNRSIYEQAAAGLKNTAELIRTHENIRTRFYNSGLTGSKVCAEFGFDIAKWLRHTYKKNVTLDSMDAPDGQIMSILSVVMPQVESEILQDENSTWKIWLKKCSEKGNDLLDTLLSVFDQSSIRPEVKDELWAAMKINVTINLIAPAQLPPHLTSIHYHRSLIKSASLNNRESDNPQKIRLSEDDAKKIIECGRMVLVRYIREIDPISFSDPAFVSYYKLSRGLSIALFGMRPERRHPIDSYMGYVVFKNGLPVSYAGSWVLFDSGRIGLNVFAPYRGGESLFIFEQILKLHKKVFHLNRFTADPYQIGKNNDEGIKSGAFWTYYKLGFRPIRNEVKTLAESEAPKLFNIKGYRSPYSVLKKLADSRLELRMGNRKPARFDATDLSLLFSAIVRNNYAGNRRYAERDSFSRLTKLLRPGDRINDVAFRYVAKNWSVILMAGAPALSGDDRLVKELNEIFQLKATGSEAECIQKIQRSVGLRKYIERVLSQNSLP